MLQLFTDESSTNEPPSVSRPDDVSFRLDQNTYDMVFINSGTRAAVILSLKFSFVQFLPREDETLGCFSVVQSDRKNIFDTDLVPLVLKEKEIITRRVTVLPGQESNKKQDRSKKPTFFMAGDVAQFNSARIAVCLEAEVATPSVSYVLTKVPLGDYYASFRYDRGDIVTSATTVPHYDSSSPKLLYRHVSPLFTSWFHFK